VKRRSKLIIAGAVLALVLLAPTLLNYLIENTGRGGRFVSNPEFAGNITVGIIESRFWGGTEYGLYNLDLTNGRIDIPQVSRFANAPNERIQGGKTPGAHIDRCGENSPVVYSPDGQYVASCRTSGPDTVVIRAVMPIKRESCTIPIWRRRHVSGIAWSPKSNAIAVLEESRRVGWGFADIFSFISGHPVLYNRFAVEVHNATCSDMTAINSIDGEFRYGWANIIKWH
jgi:hypothetical protein